MELATLTQGAQASIWWPNMVGGPGPFYAPFVLAGFGGLCILFGLFALASWLEQRRAWRV